MTAEAWSPPLNGSLDYGHPLEFGYFLIPDAADPQGVLKTARLADDLGYDLLGVQDHPYQPRHLDTSSLLATILAQTEAVRVFADVGNLPLRPPAVLAKAAATLDLLSGGRFELGIGAGGYLDAVQAMGAPARTPAESLEALEEAVALVRAFWSGERRGIRFDGSYYRLAGVHPGPAPAHPIQVWIGANKPRALALTGRVADGWVSPLMSYKRPREAAQANLAINRAAREAGREAGRDPRAIRRIYSTVQGAFTGTTQGPASDTDQGIVGPPEHWAQVLTHLALDIGFGTFVLATPADPHTLATFIEDVAQRVHGRVSERRASSLVPAVPRESERVTAPVAFEKTPETTRGRMLYRMLLAVHAGIRGELVSVERLAAAVVNGMSVDGVNEELEALRNDTTLWQFQATCLRYCRFVHSHHHAEDTDFFYELEETNPAIRPVVERLRAEHRAVADHLDAVEAAARALTDNDSVDARRAVADALGALEQHLLAHLEYEERNIAATARRLRDLPFSNQLPEIAESKSPHEGGRP